MKHALIVAHGQPSDPEPAAAEIAALAARVDAVAEGWSVRSATLAEADALAREVQGKEGVIYPLFMAEGWFTRTHLPERLAKAGGAGWRILPPFGTDPAIADLTLDLARAAGRPILLAAHGSFRSAEPSRIAHDMAARIAAETGRPSRAAFIDQTPQIAEVAAEMPEAACLPFFAARGGHVIDDLPEALDAAGFTGPRLDPVGLDPRVPGIIAAALQACR
ncbi:CbiX/SirB N-terminal domain-containing protein [Falsirhodobacter algicola]|uniref:Cobalamin biosynthesis protein CbiX n=1 Tax=Falsirhodobacter algicola TaxID=2692330 RepID=A0A8J8SL51_9RHOB|nr:CbiX/SirB N-terminal domain-containing protein [Falsirhodobacter algicola]QUS36670.1 cobalamin biosynthesis protein CbiX [Falsirhodobacter algicola]